MIKKIQGRWVLFSKDGRRRLGTFATREEAERREEQIKRIKHAKEGKRK